ncbi:hypothetical protein LCGC14_2736370, partial [marine sediment metagenome]
SRKRMIQAILFFSYLLQPRYNKRMKEASKKIKEKVKENLKKYNNKKMSKDEYVIKKLGLMEKLFEKLNYLLMDINYLKAKLYEDNDLDDDEKEEDDDKEEEEND